MKYFEISVLTANSRYLQTAALKIRRRRRQRERQNTQTNVNAEPVTTATIPYIRDTSETIARILQRSNIRVAHKPITILRRLLDYE